MPKYVMGVDPGKSGAIALLGEDKELLLYVFPRKGTEIDLATLALMFRDLNKDVSECYMEDVHAIFGSSAKSTFAFGRSVGQLEACIVAAGIKLTKVQPKAWQAIAWCKDDLVQTPTKRKYKRTGLPIMKTNTKATSLNAARRVFPDEDFLPSKRHRTPHDGMYDAALIAFAGRTIGL
jgi:hypothetical protein